MAYNKCKRGLPEYATIIPQPTNIALKGLYGIVAQMVTYSPSIKKVLGLQALV